MRRLTDEDQKRGWIPMECGKHAWVFRGDIPRRLREAGITDDAEYCDCSGTRFYAAKVDALLHLERLDTAKRNAVGTEGGLSGPSLPCSSCDDLRRERDEARAALARAEDDLAALRRSLSDALG